MPGSLSEAVQTTLAGLGLTYTPIDKVAVAFGGSGIPAANTHSTIVAAPGAGKNLEIHGLHLIAQAPGSWFISTTDGADRRHFYGRPLSVGAVSEEIFLPPSEIAHFSWPANKPFAVLNELVSFAYMGGVLTKVVES